MNRRKFLLNSTAVASSLFLQSSLASASTLTGRHSHKGWKLGWNSIKQSELLPLDMKVYGNIPEQITGTLFRNGPARYERGGNSHTHWFDGDGMIQKFSIAKHKIVHQGCFVKTDKYAKEQQAGELLYSGTGTFLADKLPARNNDSINVANTSIIEWHNEMLALWEGGSAYRLDATGQKTLGLKTWKPELKHMPFSAHPKIDKDIMWNFGLVTYAGKSGSLILYKICQVSGQVDYQLVPMPFAGYVHDFSHTADKLIFYISPYHYDHEHGPSYVQRFKWEPQKGGRILLVDKNDLSNVQMMDAPAGFVFHFGQARQKGNDIELVASWFSNPDIMRKGMYQMLGSDSVSYPKSHASILRIQQKQGRVELTESSTELEFPTYDSRHRGQAERVFGVGRQKGALAHYANATLSWNMQTGAVDQYNFGSGIIAEEPVFIADKNSTKSGQGWLLQTTLDYKKQRTEIYIFNALNIADGPIAMASMPRALPLGFHGSFVAQSA